MRRHFLGQHCAGGAAGAYAECIPSIIKQKTGKFYIEFPLILVLWIVIVGIVIKYIIYRITWQNCQPEIGYLSRRGLISGCFELQILPDDAPSFFESDR